MLGNNWGLHHSLKSTTRCEALVELEYRDNFAYKKESDTWLTRARRWTDGKTFSWQSKLLHFEYSSALECMLRLSSSTIYRKSTATTKKQPRMVSDTLQVPELKRTQPSVIIYLMIGAILKKNWACLSPANVHVASHAPLRVWRVEYNLHITCKYHTKTFICAWCEAFHILLWLCKSTLQCFG